MKKNLLFINAAVMTLTSLFLRTTGIMYRAFLSEQVTSEGMGLHTLTFSVFTFGMVFSTAGINTAVTRMISEQIGRHLPSTITAIMRKAFAYALTVSIFAAAILFSFADFLAKIILADMRTALLLKLIAPSLPFMAVSACIKGYFLAIRKASKSAVSDVIEQFTEIGVFVLTVKLFAPYGIEYACAAIMLGVTLSEAASCLYLVLCYLKSRHAAYTVERRPESHNNYLRKLLRIAVPVAISSSLGAGLRTVENIMIPGGLRKSGMAHDRALSLYGMVRGMAIPVMFFPAAFLSAFSSLLIPELSGAKAAGNEVRIRYIVSRVLQLTVLLSSLVTGVFMVFSNEIGLKVYNSTDVGKITWILAPLTVLMYADAIVDGMLKGLDLQINVLWYNIIDSTIRIVLIALLVPTYGFSGFMIVMYVSNIFNPVVSIRKLIQTAKVKLDKYNLLFKPILAASAAGMIVQSIVLSSETTFFSTTLGLTIGILFMSCLYFLLLMFMKCLTEEDIFWIYHIIIGAGDRKITKHGRQDSDKIHNKANGFKLH